MTIPTKRDFDEVEKIINKRKERVERLKYESYSSNRPHNLLKESTLEACNVFVSDLYDDYMEYINQIESSKAYHWLVADHSFKFALKTLFGTQNLQRPSRDEYISRVGARLFESAAPVTKVGFYLKEQSRRDWLKCEMERLRLQCFTEDEIVKELSNDFKPESFDEINSKEKRLEILNFEADTLQQSLLYDFYRRRGGDFITHVLSVIGDYFYNPARLIDHEEVLRGDEYREIDQDEVNRKNRGVQSIDALLPFLKEELDAEDGVLAERYKKIIEWLEILKEESEDMINSDLYVSNIGFKPIIKRKDEKAKERALAFLFWKVVFRYSKNRPVSALVNLLSIEGIAIPHERTIERWLASWDEEWVKEL